jgi:hypothetical protein
MSLLEMKASIYWLVAILLFSGCGPNASEPLDLADSPFPGEVDPDLAKEGFYEMFDAFNEALIGKNWENLYNLLRIEEKKYFPRAEVFVDYMAKGTRLWELRTFDVLSKKIDIYDGTKVEVEVYFHAEIIPGPTEHYGSLVFKKTKDEDWSVLNLELLRLPRIQFQKD